MSAIVTWIPLLLRRRKRAALISAARGWPVVSASLLGSKVVEKDPLADGGITFQGSQVETAFYFTLPEGIFGGHLRSRPMSDSEAHRALKMVPEDMPVRVRYNPANPDQTVVLAEDNTDFPFPIWPR
jgi:hypothetical protein